MPKQYQYDPTETLSYEHYVCPVCKSDFFGGGPALHERDCSAKEQGYDACIVIFGPKQVEQVIQKVDDFGEKHGSWYGLTIQVLREQFPELLPEHLRTAATGAPD